MTIDRLTEYGVDRMDEGAVRDFLSSQRSGVLGLPSDGAPYLLPMSFGFDGESRLYFTFVVGPDSLKRDLSDRADSARFLVYSAQTPFVWESVLLTGTIEALPQQQWGSVEEYLEEAWRPELLDSAGQGEDVAVYCFEIQHQEGIRHSGLSPGLAEDSAADTSG